MTPRIYSAIPAGAEGNAPSYSVWKSASGVVQGRNNHTGAIPHTGSTADVVVAAILAELGSNPGSISFSVDTHSIAANVTVPSNIGLHLPKGALLSIVSGVTLLHLGPADFPLSQCFVATGKNDGTAGSGTMSFAGGSVSTAYADWWGYTGVDDSASIHNAANSGVSAVGYLGKTYVLKSIMAPNADYLQNALVGLPNTPCRHFSLAGFTTIKLADHFLDQTTDATSNAHMFGNTGTCVGAHFNGITFDGNGQNNLNPAGKTRNAMAIRLVNGNDFAAEGCTFKNFAGHNVIALNLNNPGVNQDARIVNNIFQNGGHNVGNGVENVNNTDFSFVYSYWDYTQFEGNKVRQDNVDIALKGFTGGVELHGSYSHATRNTFVGCDPAVYSVGNTNPTTDVHVDDNTMLQCRRGVVLGQQNNSYQRVSASRNIISLYTSSIAPAAGGGYCLGIEQTGGVSTTTTFNAANSNAGPITDLEVNDNVILSLVPIPSTGVPVRAMVLHSVNRGHVERNRVSGMSSTSYFIDGSPWGWSGVEWRDNTGLDGGTDPAAEHSVLYLNWSGQVAAVPNVKCWAKNALFDGLVGENVVTETFDQSGNVVTANSIGNLQQVVYAPGLATAVLSNIDIRNVRGRNIPSLYAGGAGTFDSQNPGIHFAPEHVTVTAYPITEQRQWYGNETIEVVGTGQRYACTQLGWTGTTPTGTATTVAGNKEVTVSSSVGLRPGMDISIAGAGTSGGTLFTYIQQIVDSTHILLVAAAITGQSGGAFSVVKATFNMVTNLGNSPSFSVWIDPATGLVHGIDNHTGLDKRSGGSSFVYATTDQAVNNILAAIGSNQASISFSADTHVFAANTTVPSNVGIHLVTGTLLSPNTGITLILNGPADLPVAHCFGGEGSVALGSAAIAKGIWLEWWGYTPGTTPTSLADATAILATALAAIPASMPVQINLGAALYAMNGVVNQDKVQIRGQGKTIRGGGSGIVPFNHANPALQIANGTKQIFDVNVEGVALLSTAADGGTGVTGLLVAGGSHDGDFDVSSYGFTGDCILVQGDATYGTYKNHLHAPKCQPSTNGNGVRVTWGGAAGNAGTAIINPDIEGTTGTGYPLVVDGCTVKVVGGWLQSNVVGGAGLRLAKSAVSGAQQPLLRCVALDIDSDTSTDTLVTVDSTVPGVYQVSDVVTGEYSIDGVMLLADGVTKTPHIGQMIAGVAHVVNPVLWGQMTMVGTNDTTLPTTNRIYATAGGGMFVLSPGSLALEPGSGIVELYAPTGDDANLQLVDSAGAHTSSIRGSNGKIVLQPSGGTTETQQPGVGPQLPTYTVSTRPAASSALNGSLIYVSDATAGSNVQCCVAGAWVGIG